MLLLPGSIIIAGGLYMGNQIRKQRKRPRKRPTLVNQLWPVSASEQNFGRNVKTSLEQKLKANGLLPFGESKRQQQLEEFSSTTAESDIEEQAINRKLALSTAAFGLASAGLWIHPLWMLTSIPVLVYLAYPFIQSGYHELTQERRVGLGVMDAVVASAMLALRYFYVDAIFFVLFYVSQKLLLKTRDTAEAQLVNILGEQPRSVWIQRESAEVEIPFETLQTNDIIVVHAGEMVPVDGVIIDGVASIDQRMLTGESMPVEKNKEDSVFAATLVLSGKILIQVEKTGSATVAAQIGEILNNTSDYKSTVETRGEVIADKSALPTLALSGVTGLLLGPMSGVAVLMAYFGYNMRVIAPLSMLNFLKMASQKSILVKDGRALELVNQVDTVVFDKTGTLTQDQPHVGAIHTWNGVDEDTLLTLAAAAEYKQTHPIALAIIQEVSIRQLAIPLVTETTYELGMGLTVKVEGKVVQVGSKRFMASSNIALPLAATMIQQTSHSLGHSLVYIAINGELGGMIELEPTIRPEAKQVVDALRHHSIELYIISGDQEKPTQHLAQVLGIEHYFADTLPENKAKLIEQLQNEGRSVCFVGDGINDSIALKKAHVSVSLRGATTIATDTAQIILMDESLAQLPHLFDLARKLDENMKNNLLATVIPGLFAVAGVYFLHFGILATTMLYNVGLVAGVANAMLPWLNQDSEKQSEKNYQGLSNTFSNEI